MQERINRVIDNHQLSCHFTDKYLYIFRGFCPLMNQITVPVKHEAKDLEKKENRYILEEELDNYNLEEYDDYKIFMVTFNFFDMKVLNCDGELINYETTDFSNINVFNANNPLIGVTKALDLSNSDRLEYLKQQGIL